MSKDLFYKTATFAEEQLQLVLPRAMRIFKEVEPGKPRLRCVDALKSGESLVVEGVWLMYYDHRPKIAVKSEEPEPCYVLVEEIDDVLNDLCYRLVQHAADYLEGDSTTRAEAGRQMQEVYEQIVFGIRKYVRANLKIVS